MSAQEGSRTSANKKVDPTTGTEAGATKDSHLPFWKPGTGHYGDTLGKKNMQSVSASIGLLLPFLDKMAIDRKGVFTIADYGSNDGFSSMPLMKSVIEYLRKKKGDDLAIQVIYEDQEKNDFNSLFARLSDDSSYLSSSRNVYPLATNTNFYKQCVPDGTCDVIFTSIATHWLDPSVTTDVNFKDHCFDNFASKEERAKMKQLAEKDWHKFMLLRTRELKPGGILLVVNLATQCPEMVGVMDKEKEDSMKDVLLDLETAWKRLRDEGIITQEEYDSCWFRLWWRSAQESKQPMVDENSEVYKRGLRVASYDETTNPCPFKTAWRQRRGTMSEEANKAQWADSVATAHKVWSHSTFQSSLSDKRTEAEKADIIDKLYERFRAAIMTKDPQTYRSDEAIFRLMAQKMMA